jgi:uncharacterized protein (DUF2147 family)
VGNRKSFGSVPSAARPMTSATDDQRTKVGGNLRVARSDIFDSREKASMRNALTSAVAVLSLSFGAIAPAIAGDPAGKWLTQEGRAKVAIGRCGDALCGTIVALKEPNDPDTAKPRTDKNNPDAALSARPLIGVQIVFDMKPNGTPDAWAGKVYNAEDGKTYTGSLTLTGADSLELKGCALAGLICKGQIWTRTK